MRVCAIVVGSFFLLVCVVMGQNPYATVTGRVVDPANATIVGAKVEIVNSETGVKYSVETNSEGIYTIPSLQPGIYRMEVSKPGFKALLKPDIVLHVQDVIAINFSLPLGSVSETVTVEAGASMVNTTDASVSTVVDRGFVENMPLNGRSFQDLILLTPGVVTTSPQSLATLGASGEFSVNGQRTESNVYLVDGVSANLGTIPGFVNVPIGGSLPGATALGTTQALVSVDALQEFRVESSTYSAEYGRSPGGQFSFVTRSGTNQWHGTAFDYLRNNFFDANDWFNDYFQKPESALRQNDFGGTLGGPIFIPRLYNGKDKTFFFFSYEGLRLVQPQAARQQLVPDAYLRACAPAALQPVLNAFPQPSSPSGTPDCANPDPNSRGSSPFVATWSNPSHLDAYSVRLDHVVSDKLKLFFRFGDTPSSSAIRSKLAASNFEPTVFTTRTYTAGATSEFSPRVGNDFRLNYSWNDSTRIFQVDNFGGAQPVNLLQLQGFPAGASPSPGINIFLVGSSLSQGVISGKQNQWNLVDTADLSFGRHQLKFGADYRRLTPFQATRSPVATYLFFRASAVQANSAFALGQTFSPAYPLYTNLSAFAQDEWKLTPRITLSMGLRWEVNPAPGSTKGKSNLPFAVQGNSLSTLTLAPPGTPLWQTSWYNFAPRLGVAYLLRDTPGRETVVRGGGGVFFDTGQQLGSYGYEDDGFAAVARIPGASFPLPPAQVSPVIVNPPPCNATQPCFVVAYPAHYQLPFTWGWNVSLQQALGKSQALTISYVGANGRRLTEFREINGGTQISPNFNSLVFIQNGLTSDYEAAQLQYQRRLSGGLTALASYTWSHSIDYGSSSAAFPAVRGSSDFDVRHNFSAALSYDLPSHFQNGFARAVLNHWGIDNRFTARTGFPVTLYGPQFIDPVTGNTNNAGLDLVSGVPVYLYGANCASVLQGLGDLGPGQGCPGGKAINPNAFTPPAGCDEFSCPAATQGNAPRNFIRGFGAWQMDFAVRREFPIYEGLKLQFRVEAFNIFNHPNFGLIDQAHSDATFGQATATLANSLGVLSPLYQMGGARSMQFALKLIF